MYVNDMMRDYLDAEKVVLDSRSTKDDVILAIKMVDRHGDTQASHNIRYMAQEWAGHHDAFDIE